MLPECRNCSGNRKIRLTGTGRTDTDGHRVLLDCLHIGLLSDGFRLNGLALGCDTDNILGHLGNLMVVALIDEGDQVAYPLLVDGFALGSQRQQAFQRPHSLIHHFLITGNFQISSSIDNFDIQILFNSLNVFIKRTEYGDQVFHPLRIDDPFNCLSHCILQSHCAVKCRSSRRKNNFPSIGKLLHRRLSVCATV